MCTQTYSRFSFHRFNTDVQLNTSELAIAKQVLEKQDIIFTDSMNKRLLTRKVNKVLSDVIPPKERTYLVSFLSVGSTIVGQLALIGKGIDCFEEKHKNLLAVMSPSLGKVMAHLLKHYNVQNSHFSNEEERLHQGGVNLLRKIPIIGKNARLQDTTKAIKLLATSNAPVLITGETGTGKELIADTVQYLSKQKIENSTKFLDLETHPKKLDINTEVVINENSFEQLRAYPWTGNIRELKNLVERALTLNPNEILDLSKHLSNYKALPEEKVNDHIEVSTVQKLIQEEVTKAVQAHLEPIKEANAKILSSSTFQDRQNLGSETENELEEQLTLDTVTKNHIIKILKFCNYKVAGKGGAAEILGLNPSTLRKKMLKLNIKLDRSTEVAFK